MQNQDCLDYISESCYDTGVLVGSLFGILRRHRWENMDGISREIEPSNDNIALLSDIKKIAGDMPGGFFVYRADTSENILYVNDIVLDIFGCDNVEEFKELTGGTFNGLVHPDDLAIVEESISRQIAENDRQLDYVEYRIIRKDGTVRWVDNFGRLVHTKDAGDFYYVLIRDITETHAAREESRRRVKVIEGLSVGFSSIYLLDFEMGTMRPYRLQGEFFRKIADDLGVCDKEEVNWQELLPIYAERFVFEEDRERYLHEVTKERIEKRLVTELSYTVNYRCRDESGNLKYMEMSIVRIEEDGFHHHAVMGYRDNTEQILRVQKELADKINIETELEREKHANEVKASFLFNISHDIRTPMNAIMGFTELAKRHMKDPEKLQDYLGKVDEANHHMITLIDDLLEMSRIDYGRIELKSEACNLAEQIDMVLDMFRSQTEEKNISLAKTLDLETTVVFLDASRFRRVLDNLVSNAVKFTPAGGSIEVSARQKQVSASGYARFEFKVADTGVGMTKEFMQRMYEAFEREETSTQTGYSGTGLGLSITKRLLDIMGGSISVTSTKGQGSVFTVDLPLKLADYVPKEAPVVEEIPIKDTDKRRILLVEDIDVNRLLAETILQEAGFLVESVPDGSDAVEAVRNHPVWYYDLVLMDIQMPVMNGYEATRSIRALGREDTALLPIIALSANAREEDKRMSMASGMNSHVAKPFDIAHLISTVNAHIIANSR